MSVELEAAVFSQDLTHKIEQVKKIRDRYQSSEKTDNLNLAIQKLEEAKSWLDEVDHE